MMEVVSFYIIFIFLISILFIFHIVLNFIETLRKKILDNRDYFIDEEKFRNGQVKDETEMTIDESEKNDIHSFKQLCID